MSTSGAGFGASGFLQGFAQSYNAAQVRRLQMELEQRHQLGGTLATLYTNARPEAQADIAQRLLTLYSTPPGKKVPKDIADISTLGRAAMQANMGAAAQGTAPAQEAGRSAAFPAMAPNPARQGPLSTVPTPSSEPPQSVPTQGPSPMALGGPPAIPPPPDLSQTHAGYSPLLSPEERNSQAAATIRATESAKLEAETKAGLERAQAMGLKPGDPGYANVVAGRMIVPFGRQQTEWFIGPNGERRPLNHDSVTGVYSDPDNGEVVDVSHMAGWSAATAPGTSPWKTFYAAGKQAGQTDTEIVNEWNTRESINNGFRMEPQTDGSIKAVPVTTATTTSRGKIPAPPTPGAPARPSASGGGGGAGAGTGGRVVGGRMPPEVAKAQSSYQDSISRYNVMSESLPKALAGDQQAMLNLLYNHIGMTIGLQKGARINQAIIDEAQKSAPWMASLLARVGIGNEFEMTPELLRGVALVPAQMHQMVSLAEGRLTEDYRKVQELQKVYQGGAPQTPEDVIAGGRAKQKPNNIPPPPTANVVPKGATHIGTSKRDGKDHYLDASGKDLGVVQ